MSAASRRLGAARRWAAACAVAALSVAPMGAAASPPSGPRPDPMAADRHAGDDVLVAVGDPLAGDPAALTEAVEAVDAHVAQQLDDLTAARDAVATAVAAQADADAAVQATELAIEELTAQSDAVVIEAFMNPPADDALAVLTSESITDAAVRHALLDMDADESADTLTRLADARDALRDQRSVQDQRRVDAADARSRAEAALGGLEAALDQQALFVLQVQGRLDSAAAAATDPAQAADIDARRAALQAALDDERARRDAEAAAAALEQAHREAAAPSAPAGASFLCPVDGPMDFDDTWGAPAPGAAPTRAPT